jgi:ABC-type multidrug transport system fused ATPase/permease subunit
MFALTRKLLALFTPGEKRRLLVLLVAILAMGVIDVVGISSILPFLAVVAQPEIIQKSQLLSTLYAWLGFVSPNRFLFFLGALALIAILVSNVVSLLVSWAILAFSNSLGYSLSVRVLEGYLRQPYVFFLNRNSTTLMLNATGEVAGVINGVLIPGMQALSKIVVGICLLLLAILVDPLLACVFLIFAGGSYLLLFKVVKKRVTRLGERSQEASRIKFRSATEAFGGIKDLLILGRTDFYAHRFRRASSDFARFQSHQGVVGMIPRYALETVAFGAIILIVLYLLATQRNVGEALPLMALYAFLGYRLMPVFQGVFYGMTQIRFNLPSLELLYHECAQVPDLNRKIRQQDEEAARPLPFNRYVELKNVSFAYPGSSAPVLSDFTLRIEKNTTVGLVGATGSGKTTVLDLLLGLLEPQQGVLVVDGTLLDPERIADWRAHIGSVSQQIYLSDDTIVRNIAFGISDERIDRERVKEAARLAHIDTFIESSLEHGYETLVGERGVRLSGGQRQRIVIARALYHDPAVLFFDEATSALDGVTEGAIIEAIAELAHRKTIVTVAHRLTTVKDCDLIYFIDKGQIMEKGSYGELIERSESFRALARDAS